MSIKLLKEYINYCNDKGINPTFNGLKIWRESYMN